MNEIEAKIIGVYGVYNITKQMWYIGSSTDVDSRFNSHKSSIKRKAGVFEDIDYDDEFKFELLREVVNPGSLELWENYYIGVYDSLDNGYNKILSSRRPEITIKQYDIKKKEINIMNESELMDLLKLEDESQLAEIKYIIPYMRITENINRYEEGEVLNFLLKEGTISAYLERADINTLKTINEEKEHIK